MKEQAITQVVAPVVEQMGLELDRLEVAAAGKRSVLRIYLDGDGPDGRGPSLDEIAEATRELSRVLDETDATGQAPYTLEVSSRGVGRPLVEPKHFRRNTGRLVELTLAEGTASGRIAATDETGLELAPADPTAKNAPAPRRVEYADITRAVVTPELRKDAFADDAADDEQE